MNLEFDKTNSLQIGEIFANIRELKKYGIIQQIDWGFVNFIKDVSDKSLLTREIILVALLTSYTFNQHQNICLDLELIADYEKYINFFDDIERLTQEEQNCVGGILKKLFVNKEQLICELNAEKNRDLILIKTATNLEKHAPLRPLVFDGISKVYLQRYYMYELFLAKDISKRVIDNQNFDLAEIDLKKLLTNIFRIGKRFSQSEEINYQLLAIINAFINNFAIITGGPGTGKTTVITVILALLLEQNCDLEIKIVAPSGKAQARVRESIREEVNFLNCSENVINKLKNVETSTIHRLLGTIYNSPYFKHNKNNQLHADVIIVDELSMVSSMLMAKLMNAIHSRTKVILLGDRDQLSSVEAGALMANLCDVFKINQFSKPFFNFLSKELRAVAKNQNLLLEEGENRVSLVNDIAIKLQHSYRFSSDKGIGVVTKKINESDAIYNEQQFEAILNSMHFDKTGHFHALNVNDLNKLKNTSVDQYLRSFIKNLKFKDEISGKQTKFSDYLNCENVEDAYQLLERFKILVADNVSEYGVHSINRLVEDVLELPVGKSLYHGRVVIITENDYNLNLFNGDIGLFWRDQKTGRIAVHFPSNDLNGKFIEINPGRLPKHETVFAMSIHRSQGSGFEKILFLLLNNPNSRMLNRELVYTAITRAKKEVHLLYNLDSLKNALYRQTDRSTGLSEHLNVMLGVISK